MRRMSSEDQLFFARFLALFIAFGVLAYLADNTTGSLHVVLVVLVVAVWAGAGIVMIRHRRRRRGATTPRPPR